MATRALAIRTSATSWAASTFVATVGERWVCSPAVRRRGWCWRCWSTSDRNLLLLDEPTNHLDIEMRQALTLALQDHEGALVVVAHDRHILRACCDELWLVANHQVAPFEGDLDDYRDWLREHAQQTSGRRFRTVTQGRQTRRGRGAAAPPANLRKPIQKRIDAIEKELAKLYRCARRARRMARERSRLCAGKRTVAR